MTKPLLNFCRPDPEGGFSYPNRCHIRTRITKTKLKKKKVFSQKVIFFSYFPYQVLYQCLGKIDFGCFGDF